MDDALVGKTICVNCKHHRILSIESEPLHWYNHLCLRNPGPKVDYTVGTVEDRHEYCRDKNHGNCKDYQLKETTQ